MADISEVMDALVGVLATAFYPTGINDPSILGKDVAVIPGWPSGNRLDKVLGSKTCCVSVFPPPNLEREHTRAMSQWITVDPPVHTVKATVSGGLVTLSGPTGAIGAGQNVGLIVDGRSYAYPIQQNDTLTDVATGLASQLIADGINASSSGPLVNVSGTHQLVARVGGRGRLIKEMDRTDRCITVTIWAASPQDRTLIGKAVRKRLTDPRFVTLVDGSGAWVRYDRTEDMDRSEREGLYRRDIQYWVEFGQYDEEIGYEIISVETQTQKVELDPPTQYPPVISNT